MEELAEQRLEFIDLIISEGAEGDDEVIDIRPVEEKQVGGFDHGGDVGPLEFGRDAVADLMNAAAIQSDGVLAAQ